MCENFVLKNFVFSAEQVKRKALVLKFPKQAVEQKRKRKPGTMIHCDYLKVTIFCIPWNLFVRW